MGNGHTCKNCRGVLYTYKNAIFPFKTNLYLSNSHNGVRITLRCIDVFYKKCVNLVIFQGSCEVSKTFHIFREILPGFHTFYKTHLCTSLLFLLHCVNY